MIFPVAVAKVSLLSHSEHRSDAHSMQRTAHAAASFPCCCVARPQRSAATFSALLLAARKTCSQPAPRFCTSFASQLAQPSHCSLQFATPAAQSSHRFTTACAACFARFLRFALPTTGGAQLWNPFRQPPPPRFICHRRRFGFGALAPMVQGFPRPGRVGRRRIPIKRSISCGVLLLYMLEINLQQCYTMNRRRRFP